LAARGVDNATFTSFSQLSKSLKSNLKLNIERELHKWPLK
jgi:hypothetical protein